MECYQLLHSCWKNRTLSMAWNWWMTLKVTEGHRKWLWLAVNQFLLVVCINNFCTLHHFRDIITDIEDTYQTWNWVIGSPGHLSRPGHRVIIMTRCETQVFPVFEKCPTCKTYISNAEMTKVIVRCLLLDWNHWMSVHAMNFYFYIWSLKILRPNTSSHISRHLELTIE